MGNSVGMRILLASAITVVITFAGFILYFDFNQRAEIREQLRSNIEEVATLAESGMANWVTARRLLVENTAQNIEPNDDAEAIAATVSRPVLQDTFAIAYYGNADGDTTFSSPIDLPDGYDPRQRPWYKDAVAAGSTTLTEPYADASSGELVITVATPVGAGASVHGVLGGDLTITALADLVRGVDLGGIGYAFLVNGEGTVLVHPDEGLTLKPMAEAFPEETPAATTGLEGLDASGDRLFAFFPVDGLPTVEWKLGFAIDRDKAFASLHDFRLTAIVTALIAVAAIIGLLHLLVRGLVSRPVNDMTGAMETLAEGRLDVAIPGAGKRDEIGRMARALAHFQEKLVENESLREETRRAETEKLKAEEAAERDRRQAILNLADQFETSVGSVVNGVSAASTELQASSDTMAAAARTASEQTTSAAAAVEQASNNVTVVASASEELSSSIQEISSQVAESSQVASAAVDEVRATAATVAKLAESASSINAVIDLINDIAEQTNLLALNATIEAARAGEARKGFAVVAQEVKSLAEQTSKATEDISGQIKAMQDNTDGTVTAMDGVGTTIERINEIAATISAAVEEQSAATREISSNASQAATGTAEASQSIAGVEASASEVGETAGGVKDAADELAGQAEKLRGEVDGFIAKLRAG